MNPMFANVEEYGIIIASIVGIILSIGLAFYLHQLVKILKGGIFARGLRILTAIPVLLIVSTLADLLSALGYGGIFEIIHDLLRITFILILFLGLRSIVEAWWKISK